MCCRNSTFFDFLYGPDWPVFGDASLYGPQMLASLLSIAFLCLLSDITRELTALTLFVRNLLT